jgi:hypothetical protein
MFQDKNNTHNSATTDHAMFTGMFLDRASTERAFNTLHDRGYTKDDISLIMSDATRREHFGGDYKNTELGTKAAEGAGKGGAIGGTIGAVAGLIAAIGTSLVIPGLGLVVIGPIAAGLTGAGVGSITGGIIGALVGAGIPEDRAKEYESSVKNGSIVLGFHPRNDKDAEFFEKTWRSN